MATNLPADRLHRTPRPIAHTWSVGSCALLLASICTACPRAAAESTEPNVLPAAIDAPVPDATLAALPAQLVHVTAARDANQLLLSVLERAVEDPNSLAAVPNQLLHAYPTLQRLHQQWSEVYDQRQMLLETLLPAHPRVQLCMVREAALQPDLQRELHAALDAARAAQPLLSAQVADLTTHVAQRAVPSEAPREPKQRPSPATIPGVSDSADEQQHLAQLEARTAALARAEQALAAAQARLAATAVNNTTISAESSRGGGEMPSQLTTGITGGLVAGGCVGLALVLVTARLLRSRAQPAITAPVPPPLPGEVLQPPTGAPTAEKTNHEVVVAPVKEETPQALPAAATGMAPPPAPPVSVAPAVTVPIAELMPSARRPCLPTPRPNSRPNRAPSRMTFKEALVRCAETAAAQGR